MKKLFLSFILAFTVLNIQAKLGSWAAKAALPTSRSTHTAFSINGKGYICGGAPDGSTNYNDLWEYNPGNNAWTQKTSMPGQGRQELVSFVVGNYAYVGLGRNVNSGDCFYSFNRYDPATNSWQAIADCPVNRYASAGFAIDSIGYITCGITPGGPRYKDLWSYNPRTDAWTEKAGLPTSAIDRAFPCVVSAGHKAYLMGGYDGSTISNKLYVYEPSTDTWTEKTTFPGGGRSFASGFAIGNTILMGMGRDAGSADNKTWYYYNPSSDNWDSAADYPTKNTVGTASFVINSKGYVCGGFSVDGSVLNYMNAFSAPGLDVKTITTNDEEILKPYYAQSSAKLYCNSVQGEFRLMLYDALGKCVFNSTTQAELEENLMFDLAHLSKGIYVVQINNAGLSKAIQILIE